MNVRARTTHFGSINTHTHAVAPVTYTCVFCNVVCVCQRRACGLSGRAKICDSSVLS